MKKKSISEKQVKAIYDWILDILNYNFGDAVSFCETGGEIEKYNPNIYVDDIKALLNILNIETITKKQIVEIAETNTCDQYLYNTFKNIE